MSSGDINIEHYISHCQGKKDVPKCEMCIRVHKHVISLCNDFWTVHPFDGSLTDFREAVTTTGPQLYSSESFDHFCFKWRDCDVTNKFCMAYTVFSITASSITGNQELSHTDRSSCANCSGFLECKHTRKKSQSEYVITSEFAHLIQHIRFMNNITYFCEKVRDQHDLGVIIAGCRESERIIRKFVFNSKRR